MIRRLAAAASLGALTLLVLHALSGALLLLPALQKSSAELRAASSGIAPHLALFHLQLAAGVAAVGALLGAVASLVLSAVWRPSALGVVALSLAGTSALALQTLAERPALFEDLLWRQGGLRARFQVLVVERIGGPALSAVFACTAVALCAAAAFRFRSRPGLVGRAFGAAFGAALLVVLARAAPGLRKGGDVPAIVILAADSLRPDRFSSEGNPRATTPHLDALRAGGLWADDFFVPIASTTASWTSLLTGVYPHAHGIRDLFPRDEETRVRLPTLPRLLAARGWQTAAVSDYAGETFHRVDLGFQTVDAPPATTLEVVAERESFQRLPLALALFSGAVGQRLFDVARYLPVNANPRDLTGRVLAQLGRLQGAGKPFLLVAFYSVTHLPFAAPMPDATAFADAGYAGQSRYSYEIQQIEDIARAGQRPPEAEVAQVRALYDGALRAFDREAGILLRRLTGEGRQKTIVVVLGDHGESLFEPGATTEHGKWFAGGEAANRTALLLAGAGVARGNIAGPSSGVDLLPTLLELAGAPIPPGLDGLSLLHPAPPSRTVFAETSLWLSGKANAPPEAIAYPGVLELLEVSPRSHALQLKRRYQDLTVTAKLRAARRGSFELVYTPRDTRPPRWRLFDLATDPFAQRDLSRTGAPVLAELQRELLEFLRRDPLRWLDPADRLVARVEE